MFNPIDKLRQALKGYSRSQLKVRIFIRLLALREWIQNNGEKAALVGVLIGVSLVLFFKVFVFVLVAGSLIGYGLYSLMEE